MKVSSTQLPVDQNDADAIVVGVYQEDPQSGPAQALDRATGGSLGRLLETKEFRGAPHELLSLYCPHGLDTTQALLVGLGKRESLDRGVAYRAAASAARKLAGQPRQSVAFYLDPDWDSKRVGSAVCGAIVGCVGQDLYRAERKVHPFQNIQWSGGDADAYHRGEVLGESINLTRRLVNEPAGVMYPETFADAATDVAARSGIEIEVWDREKLAQERCGALLAVAQGSSRPPRMVLLRYRGASDSQTSLALIGKGVTFDSGGLSLKPSDGMKTMKCDMAGAATVLGAIHAIAKLRLPVNVLAIMGLVENMVSGSSFKLGDVLTARNGKTIEIHNTDAEGRLVLADALAVAVEQNPRHIVDLATLTGACVVALGTDVAGLMSNNQAWCDQVAEAARACGEWVWQLPMFPEYAEQIKADIADIKNVGEGRWGGAITAAKFLEEFVDGKPWTHIDIAGPAFREKPKPWSESGGTGTMVQTLVELVENMGNRS
jgi:leucyl aminopeptidase